MEKLEKKHHDHSFTECLKNIIFGLVMLAPFLSIGVRCGYVIRNKNAKDSYSEYYTETALNVDSSNQSSLYIDGQRVSFANTRERPLQWNSGNYGFRDISLDLNSLLNTIGKNYIYFNLYKDNHNIKFVADDSSFAYLNDYQNTFTFIVDTSNGSEVGLFNYGVVNIFTFTNGTLDNAFSYSVSQISNDPVFNWTRNTGIYQPINAMIEGLEIENDTLQILLAYWSLMTAVYIVFDLIIFCFTKITHFING